MSEDELREQLAWWKTEAHEKESMRAALQKENDLLREALDEDRLATQLVSGADVLNRDWLANTIDAYMSDAGEFRSYDLADRIIRKRLSDSDAILPAPTKDELGREEKT